MSALVRGMRVEKDGQVGVITDRWEGSHNDIPEITVKFDNGTVRSYREYEVTVYVHGITAEYEDREAERGDREYDHRKLYGNEGMCPPDTGIGMAGR